MTTISLGRLEPVDLRTVWANEASAFTPWLAKEENLRLLGDTIGIELQLEAQEKNVGPFRADLLCKDTATDHWVLVENQLERTDHCHLGQLLTYAAGLKAVTLVWVAPRFAEEHRAAIDWLNEITDESLNFFGLEVEAWRIGDSAVAPKFNIVCKPNDWSRIVSDAARTIEDGGISETKQLQLEYWEQLNELLIARGGDVRPQKAAPKHWANFSLGRTGFKLTATLNTQQNFIRVLLVTYGKDSDPHYRLLLRDRIQFDRAMGEELFWFDEPNIERWIGIRRDNFDLHDRTQWADAQGWMIERLERLHRVFAKRIKELDADQWQPGQGGTSGVRS